MTTERISDPGVGASTAPAEQPKVERIHCYDQGYYLSEPLGRSGVVVLWYANGTIRVRHDCKVVDGDQLVVAPALQLDNGGHRIVQERPLTVEPSVLCPDCGLHGFIRQQQWVAA